MAFAVPEWRRWLLVNLHRGDGTLSEMGVPGVHGHPQVDCLAVPLCASKYLGLPRQQGSVLLYVRYVRYVRCCPETPWATYPLVDPFRLFLLSAGSDLVCAGMLDVCVSSFFVKINLRL